MSTHGSRTLIAVFYREKDSAAACGDGGWAISMRRLGAAAAAMVGLVFVQDSGFWIRTASVLLLSIITLTPSTRALRTDDFY